jgi:hypothetical protein
MPEETTTAPEDQTGAPATPAPNEPTPKTPPAKKSLEDSLAALDESTRTFVLGEVTSARTEAKGLRERLKTAEPKIAEYDRLVAASKTDAERAQEAREAAETRAAKALHRAARAEVKAALASVVDNADAIVKTLDMSQFIDDEGEVDQDALTSLQQTYSAFSAPRKPRPDPSAASGANGKTPASPAAEFASFLQRQIHPS